MTKMGPGTVENVSDDGITLTVRFDPPVQWSCGCGIHEISMYIVEIDSVSDAGWRS